MYFSHRVLEEGKDGSANEAGLGQGERSVFQRGKTSRRSFQNQVSSNQSQSGNTTGQATLSGSTNNQTTTEEDQVPQQTQLEPAQTVKEAKKDKKISAASKIAKGFGLKREKSLKSNGSNSSSVSQQQQQQLTTTASTTQSTAANAVPNRGARPASLALSQSPYSSSLGPASPIGNAQPTYIPTTQRLNIVPEDEWIEDPYFYEDYISEDEVEDYSSKPVPIWLSILLVLIYIGFGAYIFRVSSLKDLPPSTWKLHLEYKS